MISDASIGEEIAPPYTQSKKVKANKSKVRNWCVGDLQQEENKAQQLLHKPSVADVPRTPTEIFELFLDDNAIKHLTVQTVQYAAQKGDHQFSLSCNDMKVFLGILLLSGYNSVPRRRLYWSTELDTHNWLVSNSMRRNRFDEIMKYFHAADNTDIRKEDRFAKVQPFMDILNKNFLTFGTVFGPSSISIDESMIPYYGRHPTKQFIRGKPIRWGYKAWAACSPLGYVFALDLYQGKCQASNQTGNANEFGLGGKVILNFLDNIEAEYPGRKFSIYFDNFFTSIRILEELKKRGHGATGTVRINRVEKCPLTPTKQFAKLPRGSEEHFLDKDSQILVVRWHDNGTVCIASNEYGLLPMKKVERYSAKEKKRIVLNCPYLIDKYNKNMGGVDRADENIAHYRIAIRGKKWYFPILSYLINISMNNAWIFAREGGYEKDLLAFTRQVVQCWLKKYGIPPKVSGKQESLSMSTLTAETRFDKVSHDIIESDPKCRRRCKECHSQTIYICKKCKVHMHHKCAIKYHAQ